MDLAHGHVLALEALQGKARTDVFAATKGNGYYRAFNLGSGGGQSVLDIASAMTKATGVKFNMEIVGRR
jgi:UDP-glucose 4-epimerase